MDPSENRLGSSHREGGLLNAHKGEKEIHKYSRIFDYINHRFIQHNADINLPWLKGIQL